VSEAPRPATASAAGAASAVSSASAEGLAEDLAEAVAEAVAEGVAAAASAAPVAAASTVSSGEARCRSSISSGATWPRWQCSSRAPLRVARAAAVLTSSGLGFG